MYYKYLSLFIIFYFIIRLIDKKEPFDNCKNISNIYNERLEYFKEKKSNLLLGYHPNNYIYKTLLMESDDPIPVNANYWFHEY